MGGEDNLTMLNRVCIMVMLGTFILLQLFYMPGEYKDALWELYALTVKTIM
jgi:hypothetical protein